MVAARRRGQPWASRRHSHSPGIAAAERARFSYREAMEKLAAATGDTLRDIARSLLAAGLGQLPVAFLGH